MQAYFAGEAHLYDYAPVAAFGKNLSCPALVLLPRIWSPLVHCPRIEVDPECEIIHIPSQYFTESGLSSATEYVYRRAEVSRVWAAIQKLSIDTYAQLWIEGPSGSGKSFGAFTFMCCCIDRTRWNVLWLHWSQEDHLLRCIQLHGDETRTHTLTFRYEDYKEGLAMIMSEVPLPELPVIVFFDGYQESALCENIIEEIKAWRWQNPYRHRLVVVPSVESLPHDYREIPSRYLLEEVETAEESRGIGNENSSAVSGDGVYKISPSNSTE